MDRSHAAEKPPGLFLFYFFLKKTGFGFMGSWICVFLPLLLPHPTIAFQMDFAYEEIQYPSTPLAPCRLPEGGWGEIRVNCLSMSAVMYPSLVKTNNLLFLMSSKVFPFLLSSSD